MPRWNRNIRIGALAMAGALLSTHAGLPGAVSLDRAGLELRARRIIERAIQAHGGREAWSGKKNAIFTTIWTHFAAGQPRFSSRYVVKFPISRGPVRTIVEADENGKPVLMGVSGSRSWFMVDGERSDDVDLLKANRAFVRRAYSLLALPFRLDDPSYSFTWDGKEVRSGVPLERVRVEHGLEPPALYLFDIKTGRLAGTGSVMADPPTALVSELDDYLLVDGIVIPRTQLFDRVDARTGARSRALTVSVDSVKFEDHLAPGTFEPPETR